MVAECSYDLRKRVIKLIEEGETIAKAKIMHAVLIDEAPF
ncbi:Uncharacterised protein [Orientia tsutsugamushi]|uniref:Uncharacterized protein n=1 Tax=Orientia tsutsugamushi TaxID=784 RepID=A0A2U3QV93_ORITS|nr:Uncharacterised protein [Orientia tsutsugamushi]